MRSRKVRIAGWTIAAAVVLALPQFSSPGVAQTSFPQVLRTRYEAADQKQGGHFIIWLEREKVYHGLDPRLYPAARYVEVTHVTPSPGSPIVTIVEVMPINATTPEYYHLAGIARFRMTGMRLVSSTIPQP